MPPSASSDVNDDVNQAIYELKSQKNLFSEYPEWLKIQQIKLRPYFPSSVRVNVWRNHAFEPLQDLIRPYFSIRKTSLEFNYSGYDNSLSFTNYCDADIELVWLDPVNINLNCNGAQLIDWLVNRIRVLRNKSYSPILIATWFDKGADLGMFCEKLESFSDVFFIDILEFCNTKGLTAFDERTYNLMGTRISRDACLHIATEFGCKWFSGLVLPPIKAVAADLDNTLYDGVLGEDEIEGIRLRPEHTALQTYLKSLITRGVFLALVSKNDYSHVESLFAQRKDFELTWEDFSAVEISWDPKSKAIENIARTLNIGVDSILFVDDNIGELLEVQSKLPSVSKILAFPDGNTTLRSVKCFPGLWRWKSYEEDQKRVVDLKANSEREKFIETAFSEEDYLRNLKIIITAHINDSSQSSRMSALSNKTNQFNLSFGRLREAEILEKLKSENYCVVCVSLSDVISDSGTVALIISKIFPSYIEIEEMCLSCRAMGRGIENYMLLWALQNIPTIKDVDTVNFKIVRGPRSEPAISWIADILGKKSDEISSEEKFEVTELFSFRIPELINLRVDIHG